MEKYHFNLSYCLNIAEQYSTYKRVFAPDEIKTNVYNWHHHNKNKFNT